MKTLTKQEIYDSLVCAALDGTFPSIQGEASICVYQGPDGKRCAVGLFHPHPELLQEGLGIVNQARHVQNYIINHTGLSLSQLMEIQQIHDGVARTYRPHWFIKEFLITLNRSPLFDSVVRVFGAPETSVSTSRHQGAV